jgi:UDP-N-acetylmuramoyl-tripeptide--D-alanyl-D-alanine ligase
MLTLADVIEALTGQRPPVQGPVITEAAVDSRQVIPGALFVALPGERVDGHAFIGQAFERGAHVALVQREVEPFFRCIHLSGVDPHAVTQPPGQPRRLPPHAIEWMGSDQPICVRVADNLQALQQIARFWRRKHSPRVVGITGSVGKSTTKEVVAEVLDQRYRTLKSPGNLNNEIGLPLTLLRLSAGHERAVLEMGFYVPGEIAFLCDIALPHVGVVTNIGTVHAERAGSQEAIFRGKAELVQALPPAPDGVAILNYDDPWVRQMAPLTQARLLFYGLDSAADLWADGVESLGLEGIRFRLHYRNETLHLRVPMIGQHSVHTALRAAAVGLAEGLTWQEIVAGLRSGTSQLRLVAVRSAAGALLLDDTYNASPESTLAALNLLGDLEGRRVAVLGDMLELGPYEAQGHEMVGVRAAQVVEELVTVGERGRLIAAAAVHAGLSSRRVTVTLNTAEALSYLTGRLTDADVVLIKGSRGMHMDAIVAGLEKSR